MKRILFLFTCLLFASSGRAIVFSVDNTIPRTGQFATLQEAHDAASSGDTLMVYPSYTPYDSLIFSKKIICIGAGFKSPQVGLKTTIIKGTIHFNHGADGSILTGFGDDFSIVVDANNVSIIKNRFAKVLVLENHNGTVILQNFISLDTDSFLIDIQPQNEVFISNNLIINQFYWSNTCGRGKGIKANDPSNTTFIQHNLLFLRGNHQLCNGENISLKIDNSNSTVQNNILIGGEIQGTQNGVFFNLTNNEQLRPSDGNIISSFDYGLYFENLWNNDFHLASASPAKGSGLNGVDMGIYGGDTPFNDYGSPSIPSIYYLDVPIVGSQKEGINVTIKVKSNN